MAILLKDGRVLVVGGFADGSLPNRTAELYDPASGTFAPTGSPRAPLEVGPAARLADGRVLVIREGTGGAEVYDPGSESFETVEIPTVGWGATMIVLADGSSTLLIGGEIEGTTASQAWIVDPDGRAQVAAGTLRGATIDPLEPDIEGPWPRRDASALLLADGRVLVVGGFAKTSGPYPIDTADLFDPAARAFESTGSLTIARADPSVTQLADGLVLVAGGTTWDGHSATGKLPIELPTASAEVYDPWTGLFEPTGTMGSARLGHTATLLTDGGVLIAGGARRLGGGDPLTSAEVYR
jgi:hypothetical protein